MTKEVLKDARIVHNAILYLGIVDIASPGLSFCSGLSERRGK